MASRTSRGKEAMLLAIAAIAIMLFLAGSSPFFPTNPWVDANCFHTVARGITRGRFPYIDLIEQKGPLLYFLHVPGVLLQPDGFFGIWLTEILALFMYMWFSLKTLRLFRPECPALMAVLPALAMVVGRCFVWGDSAEELCAPIFAYALYGFFDSALSPEGMPSNRRCLIHGILAGCVFWIKYSLLGLYFAWMACFALDCLFRQRAFGRAVKASLCFLCGMAIASIPWIALYAALGGLDDLWQVYFVQNLTAYGTDRHPLLGLVMGLFGGAYRNALAGTLILGGALWLCIDQIRQRRIRVALGLAAMLLCATGFQYGGGMLNDYYYYISACFAPLGCLAILWLKDALRRHLRWLVWAAVAVGCVWALAVNRNLPHLFTPKEALVQTQFAQIMDRPDATLLNGGFLDGGFYLSSGIEPTNRWFCTLLANRSECLEEHGDIIESGTVTYVVTRNKTLQDYDVRSDHYRLIAQGRETFNYKEPKANYYLYERIDAPTALPGDSEAQPVT